MENPIASFDAKNTSEEDVGTLSSTQEKPEPQKPSLLSEIVIFLRDICIILIIVFTLRTYIASPFRINGASMESSYHNNELILVDKISYNLERLGITKNTGPARGDVVVIQPHSIAGKDFFIKRIIGIPGDTIKIENGYILLRPAGKKEFTILVESYLNSENNGKTYPGRSSTKSEFQVPEGEYFILGDNRNGSSDSRDCFYTCSAQNASYYIKKTNIVGRLWVTFGAFRILEPRNIDPITGEEREDGKENTIFSIEPRFLDTPKTWNYTELQ